MKKVFLLFLNILLLPLLAQEPFYYFIPPSNWDLVDPSKLTNKTQIAFVCKSNKPFKASLNLGTEKVSISIENYIKAVKKRLSADRNNTWMELGFITTQAGKAHISQIDSKNGCGDIRSMQCILIKDSIAYVLTAVSLKEDFTDYYNQFLKTFESFAIYPDALSSLQSEDLKKTYQKKAQELLVSWTTLYQANKTKTSIEKVFADKGFQKKQWKNFEKFLQKSYGDKGFFWQAMAAKEMKEMLISSSK